MDSLIISSWTLPREIYVLWVNMSVATSAKRTSIIFSPRPQKWLPWQRHFATPQYPEIAEYSLYLTAESASPAHGIGAKMFYYLLPFAFLRETGAAYIVSSVNFLIRAPSLVLCFEKGNRGKNSDLVLVLWFHESEIYSPVSLLEDWLKKGSLWTLFQTRGGCNNCNLLLCISPCEGGRNFIYLSVTVKMRDVGGLHSNSSSHKSPLYL